MKRLVIILSGMALSRAGFGGFLNTLGVVLAVSGILAYNVVKDAGERKLIAVMVAARVDATAVVVTCTVAILQPRRFSRSRVRRCAATAARQHLVGLNLDLVRRGARKAIRRQRRDS